MPLSRLRRTSGPHGTAYQGDTTTLLEGWELSEADPISPHEYQGWFTCSDEFFTARKGSELDLKLQSWNDGIRKLHVVIEKIDVPEHQWEFYAHP